MTIHRARLGPDLLRGARDDKPLSLFGIAIVLVSFLLTVILLGVMIWYLWTALEMRNVQAWNEFWDQTRDTQLIGIYAVIGPLSIATICGTSLYERTARRYALLGDDRWAPALDVQPTPLSPDDQAQETLDFGTIYASQANLAIAAIIGGFLMIAAGTGFVWLAMWGLQQSWPIPASELLVVSGFAALVIVFIAGFIAGGIWLMWLGARRNGGLHLTGDDTALHIYTRRGRERARIAWHEIRALAAQLPAAGSDRTTYYLDTGDRVLMWVEQRFDPSTVRAQRALLRRAVVTRTGVPLRDVTPVYNARIFAALRDLVPWPHGVRGQFDSAVPTESDRAIWQPIRALHRIEQRLLLVGGILFVLVLLLYPIAFALQHLLG